MLAVIIGLIIRKCNQLSDVIKSAKLPILKANLGSLFFRLDCGLSITDGIGLLDLDIRQRQTIDKNGNVWTKLIFTILASHLKSYVKGIGL